MSDRGVSPVIGKTLEIGIVLLYVTSVTAALYGGVVPDARSAAAEELADRTLAAAATDVEESVPTTGRRPTATIPLALPDRIRGETYVLRTAGRQLVLDHPHARVGAAHRLALPDRVVAVRGRAASDEAVAVRVTRAESGLVVEVTEA